VDKADVTMVFPNLSNNSLDCVMSLYISSNKVQYLVMGLFGINLETEGRFRYANLPNGARLRPDDVILQGVTHEAIDEFLSCRIRGAIDKSPSRQEEVRFAIYRTECVSLRLTNGATEDALLTIAMELDDEFQIKEVLFK
jgi:hypothetical protein